MPTLFIVVHSADRENRGGRGRQQWLAAEWAGGARLPKRDVSAVGGGIALPIVADLGLELVDVEWVKEASHWYLRLYIDKPGGVTLDDCEAVSRAVSERMDAVDPIPEQYLFEVSSPGLERPLKKDADFARFVGQMVEVSTYAAVEGQRRWRGELLGLANGLVRLRVAEGKGKTRELAIEKAQVAKARLYVEL